jgi:hypothetical protein
MSFVIFRLAVDNSNYKDQNIKPLLYLLAKVFALKQLNLDSFALYETGHFSRGSKSLIDESLKSLLI